MLTCDISSSTGGITLLYGGVCVVDIQSTRDHYVCPALFILGLKTFWLRSRKDQFWKQKEKQPPLLHPRSTSLPMPDCITIWSGTAKMTMAGATATKLHHVIKTSVHVSSDWSRSIYTFFCFYSLSRSHVHSLSDVRPHSVMLQIVGGTHGGFELTNAKSFNGLMKKHKSSAVAPRLFWSITIQLNIHFMH